MSPEATPPSPRSKKAGALRARHIALIVDGNRRWAREHGVGVTEGHEAGADTLISRVRDAVELGVQELTIYLFSTENWARPSAEVDALMQLLVSRAPETTSALHRDGVRIRFIGRRDGLSSALLEQMETAETTTAANSAMTLFLAINYGGRAEILDAASRFRGHEEEDLRACLYAPEMHDPELLIRTGGEQRLSNFLLWQAAYTELVFRGELWPDFTRRAFEESLNELPRRQRRFGSRPPAEIEEAV
jgi:undecaprenyl diphosphate synthase